VHATKTCGASQVCLHHPRTPPGAKHAPSVPDTKSAGSTQGPPPTHTHNKQPARVRARAHTHTHTHTHASSPALPSPHPYTHPPP
jgi:hypothetical protein